MNYLFHPEAEAELNRAVEYYEEKEAGLGLDFAREVYQSIQRARSFPEAWPVLSGEVRRILVNRFPYGVLYVPEEDKIFIIAVMNLNQKPGYWEKRSR